MTKEARTRRYLGTNRLHDQQIRHSHKLNKVKARTGDESATAKHAVLHSYGHDIAACGKVKNETSQPT